MTHVHIVRFADTDAAGVAYFARLFDWCHAAYEESLHNAGLDLPVFFSGASQAVPIVHAEADYRAPLRVGDRLHIHLSPKPRSASSFEIRYRLERDGQLCATALTVHCCIDPATGQRSPLSPTLQAWLDRAQGVGEVSEG